MTARRHMGLLLATVLVLGTVVSPVVHYSWMALGGNFNAPHGVTGHDMGAHHAGDHGQQASTDDLEHLTCDYSNLFGTFSAYETSAPEHVAPCLRPAVPVVIASLVDAVSSVDSIQLRGPPVV